MSKRIRFNRRIRQKIFEKSNGYCYYCGRPLTKSWEIDHKRPLSKGGSNKTPNLVASCHKCNRLKADMTVGQFRQYVKNSGNEWFNGSQFVEKHKKGITIWGKLKKWLYGAVRRVKRVLWL